MYELRAVAENISRERGHNSEVYPQDTPLYGVPFEECEVQVTNASNAEVSQIAQEVTNAGNAVNVSGVIIPDASEGWNTAWKTTLTKMLKTLIPGTLACLLDPHG
jgi:hypothetical protein